MQNTELLSKIINQYVVKFAIIAIILVFIYHHHHHHHHHHHCLISETLSCIYIETRLTEFIK